MNYSKIKTYSENKNISIRDLALYCGISEVGLHQMIRNASMKVDVLEKICEKLEVSPEIFFETPKTTITAKNIYAANKNVHINTGGDVVQNASSTQQEVEALKRELAAKDKVIELYEKLLQKNS